MPRAEVVVRCKSIEFIEHSVHRGDLVEEDDSRGVFGAVGT